RRRAMNMPYRSARTASRRSLSENKADGSAGAAACGPTFAISAAPLMFFCCMGSHGKAGRVRTTRPALILTMLFEIVSRHNGRTVSVMGGDLFAFELLDKETHGHFA